METISFGDLKFSKIEDLEKIKFKPRVLSKEEMIVVGEADRSYREALRMFKKKIKLKKGEVVVEKEE
jgi:hypothetical protein